MVSQADQTQASTLPSPVAARYIGMSDSWLRQSRMSGRSDGPPFLRMGARAVRYRLTDLDQWLEQRVCAGGAPPKPAPAPAPPPFRPKRGRKPLTRNGGRRRSVR